MQDISKSSESAVMAKQVSAEQPDTYFLSPEQRQFYEENGFVVIKQLIDFASLYSYKQQFLRICKSRVPNEGLMHITKEQSLLKTKKNPEDYINKVQEILYDDVFIEYAFNPRLVHVLRQLIGDDFKAIHSIFFNKPPGANRHPAHQDLLYFPHRPADKIVASWTAVDYSTVENGCLYVVPGSHKQKMIWEHGQVKNASRNYHGILDEEVAAPLHKRVDLEMAPGDTVFFHPYLVHGSRANESKNYRKAIAFHFANSDCHMVEVMGTVQQLPAREIMHAAKQRGFEIGYNEIWQMKSRQIYPKSKI